MAQLMDDIPGRCRTLFKVSFCKKGVRKFRVPDIITDCEYGMEEWK